jgi:hypothetical protein
VWSLPPRARSARPILKSDCIHISKSNPSSDLGPRESPSMIPWIGIAEMDGLIDDHHVIPVDCRIVDGS